MLSFKEPLRGRALGSIEQEELRGGMKGLPTFSTTSHFSSITSLLRRLRLDGWRDAIDGSVDAASCFLLVIQDSTPYHHTPKFICSDKLHPPIELLPPPPSIPLANIISCHRLVSALPPPGCLSEVECVSLVPSSRGLLLLSPGVLDFVLV